jgi:hypothetical protein
MLPTAPSPGMQFLLLSWRRTLLRARRRLASAVFAAQLFATFLMRGAPSRIVHFLNLLGRRTLLRARRRSILIIPGRRLLPRWRTIVATRRWATIARRRGTAIVARRWRTTAIARRRRPVARPIRAMRVVDARAKRSREAHKRDTGKNTIHSGTHKIRKSLRSQFRPRRGCGAIGRFPTWVRR